MAKAKKGALRVGLIGCGNISDIYLTNASLFRDIEFTACADLMPEAAARQAKRYTIAARPVDQLLASEDVDIVLNLTIPEVHAEVSMAALAAGKHVYTEKPLATTLADGVKVMQAAVNKGLRVGAAPDTVLGASIQEARRLIDAGAIGKPLTGTAAFLSHGMEHWHPSPGFFFRPGGGPVFDMGPYYLSALITLFGPIASGMASGQMGFAERVVTTKSSPIKGQAIKVETLTSLQALLQFENGAQIAFLASWDIWKHGMLPLELHGTEASLRVPDPNWFGGDLRLAKGRGAWKRIETKAQFLGRANYPKAAPLHANYRGLGLADMARAIKDRRPHRANGEIGLHVLAVMAGILEAAGSGRRVTLKQGCARPAALGPQEAASLMA